MCTHFHPQIQVALRHKSEIEHHRNKIRLRAKRKGHYDFPAMDEMITGFGDKDKDRIYQKEQMQIDKILDPDAQMSSAFMEPKKRLELIFLSHWVENLGFSVWLIIIFSVPQCVPQRPREALAETEDEGADERRHDGSGQRPPHHRRQ